MANEPSAGREVELANATVGTQERMRDSFAHMRRDQTMLRATRQLIEHTRAFLRDLPPIEQAFHAWRR
jgi:hypothetical protein